MPRLFFGKQARRLHFAKKRHADFVKSAEIYEKQGRERTEIIRNILTEQ